MKTVKIKRLQNSQNNKILEIENRLVVAEVSNDGEEGDKCDAVVLYLDCGGSNTNLHM